MNTKYVDEGFHLLHWATEVEALCPRCSSVGLIKGNPHYKEWSATFMCTSCSHSLKTDRDGWHGPVLGIGQRPCCACGKKWVRVEKTYDDASAIKTNTENSRCENCNTLNEVELDLYRSKPLDHSIEPFFGLDLALKEETRHGVVWAYSASHLAELKKYIGAQLRESSGTKWSYFTRLPGWLKSAKNREQILKVISKLESRVITKQC